MNKKISELGELLDGEGLLSDVIAIINQSQTKKATLEQIRKLFFQGEILINTEFSIKQGDFEFFQGIEPVYKAKTGQDLPFTGFRYYNDVDDVLFLMGLGDTSLFGGGKQLLYSLTDFANDKRKAVVAQDDSIFLMSGKISDASATFIRSSDDECSLEILNSSGSTTHSIKLSTSGEFELEGCPEYIDDTAAGVAGLSVGKMYFNTTLNAYSKKL